MAETLFVVPNSTLVGPPSGGFCLAALLASCVQLLASPSVADAPKPASPPTARTYPEAGRSAGDPSGNSTASLWTRIVLIGASATAGFVASEPLGGPATTQCRLNRYLDAAIGAPH